MTAVEEALQALRRSVRRHIQMGIGVLALATLTSALILTLLGREWGLWWLWSVLHSVLAAVTWGVILWFFIDRSDMEWIFKISRLDDLTPANVTEVGPGKRLTVGLATGEVLVWRTRRATRLAAGQQVWLVPPVETQRPIVTVAPNDDDTSPRVLWPKELSRPPGRWDC
ncbi:MAG: hypothetical protein WA892_05950 [Ornithinimicrobium sp.]